MSKENWKLSFNGVEYPAPTDYKVDFEPIVDAQRNANGDMILEYIAEKRRLNLQWKRLNGEYYQKILQSRKGANITGSLSFFDPSEGMVVEMKAYASPVTAPLIRYEDGLQMWENVSVNFIEL